MSNINKTLVGLQPETPIPLDRPRHTGVRPRRVFIGTPVHIPPPRRVHRRSAPLSPLGAQLVAGLVVCYLIAIALAASVWL